MYICLYSRIFQYFKKQNVHIENKPNHGKKLRTKQRTFCKTAS